MFNIGPLSIVDLPAKLDHFTRGRPAPPRVIVLHATGGTDSRDWLTWTSSPPVSVHRLIATDGVIYKLVDDHDTAWGCGPSHLGPYYPTGPAGNLNAYALQIELENLNKQGSFYPAVQVAAAGRQVASWWQEWGVMPVLGHAMLDERKTDPVQFPWPVMWQTVFSYWK